MGTVYRAFDTILEREVALKMMKPELLNDPAFLESVMGGITLAATRR